MSGRHGAKATTATPRVLVFLNTEAAWSRGVLKALASAAHAHGWTALHYHSDADVAWLAKEWTPAAVIVGPEPSRDDLLRLAPLPLVSVTVDRSADGIASVCLDEEAIGALALEHLLATGLRRFVSFRLSNAEFAIERERAFLRRARAAGANIAPSWGSRDDQRTERPGAILQWLHELEKPCGIFTCTDRWGALLSRYARVAGLRVPEDVALIGVDNDTFECELITPPLSSVMIPWQGVGESAAELVRLMLSGAAVPGTRSLLSPVTVVGRRSSDLFAAGDALVSDALRWIRDNAERRITVGMLARALGGGRQRLERRFRAVLQRTVHDEIRRAHVDVAKQLLETTNLSLAQIAERSGFTNAALLNVAFHRELGSAPGVYRRRAKHELDRERRGHDEQR